MNQKLYQIFQTIELYNCSRYTLIGVTSMVNESDAPGNSTSTSSNRFLFPTKYCAPPAVFARVSEVKQWILDNTEGTQDSSVVPAA